MINQRGEGSNYCQINNWDASLETDNTVACSICVSLWGTVKETWNRLFDTKNFAAVLQKPRKCASHLHSTHASSCLQPFFIFCITPCLCISGILAISLSSFKYLFKFCLVKPTQHEPTEKMPFHMDHPKNGRRVSATGIKLDLALSECFISPAHTDRKLSGQK